MNNTINTVDPQHTQLSKKRNTNKNKQSLNRTSISIINNIKHSTRLSKSRVSLLEKLHKNLDNYISLDKIEKNNLPNAYDNKQRESIRNSALPNKLALDVEKIRNLVENLDNRSKFINTEESYSSDDNDNLKLNNEIIEEGGITLKDFYSNTYKDSFMINQENNYSKNQDNRLSDYDNNIHDLTKQKIKLRNKSNYFSNNTLNTISDDNKQRHSINNHIFHKSGKQRKVNFSSVQNPLELMHLSKNNPNRFDSFAYANNNIIDSKFIEEYSNQNLEETNQSYAEYYKFNDKNLTPMPYINKKIKPITFIQQQMSKAERTAVQLRRLEYGANYDLKYNNKKNSNKTRGNNKLTKSDIFNIKAESVTTLNNKNQYSFNNQFENNDFKRENLIEKISKIVFIQRWWKHFFSIIFRIKYIQAIVRGFISRNKYYRMLDKIDALLTIWESINSITNSYMKKLFILRLKSMRRKKSYKNAKNNSNSLIYIRRVFQYKLKVNNFLLKKYFSLYFKKIEKFNCLISLIPLIFENKMQEKGYFTLLYCYYNKLRETDTKSLYNIEKQDIKRIEDDSIGDIKKSLEHYKLKSYFLQFSVNLKKKELEKQKYNQKNNQIFSYNNINYLIHVITKIHNKKFLTLLKIIKLIHNLKSHLTKNSTFLLFNYYKRDERIKKIILKNYYIKVKKYFYKKLILERLIKKKDSKELKLWFGHLYSKMIKKGFENDVKRIYFGFSKIYNMLNTNNKAINKNNMNLNCKDNKDNDDRLFLTYKKQFLNRIIKISIVDKIFKIRERIINNNDKRKVLLLIKSRNKLLRLFTIKKNIGIKFCMKKWSHIIYKQKIFSFEIMIKRLEIIFNGYFFKRLKTKILFYKKLMPNIIDITSKNTIYHYFNRWKDLNLLYIRNIKEAKIKIDQYLRKNNNLFNIINKLMKQHLLLKSIFKYCFCRKYFGILKSKYSTYSTYSIYYNIYSNYNKNNDGSLKNINMIDLINIKIRKAELFVSLVSKLHIKTKRILKRKFKIWKNATLIRKKLLNAFLFMKTRFETFRTNTGMKRISILKDKINNRLFKAKIFSKIVFSKRDKILKILSQKFRYFRLISNRIKNNENLTKGSCLLEDLIEIKTMNNNKDCFDLILSYNERKLNHYATRIQSILRMKQSMLNCYVLKEIKENVRNKIKFHNFLKHAYHNKVIINDILLISYKINKIKSIIDKQINVQVKHRNNNLIDQSKIPITSLFEKQYAFNSLMAYFSYIKNQNIEVDRYSLLKFLLNKNNNRVRRMFRKYFDLIYNYLLKCKNIDIENKKIAENRTKFIKRIKQLILIINEKSNHNRKKTMKCFMNLWRINIHRIMLINSSNMINSAIRRKLLNNKIIRKRNLNIESLAYIHDIANKKNKLDIISSINKVRIGFKRLNSLSSISNSLYFKKLSKYFSLWSSIAYNNNDEDNKNKIKENIRYILLKRINLLSALSAQVLDFKRHFFFFKFKLVGINKSASKIQSYLRTNAAKKKKLNQSNADKATKVEFLINSLNTYTKNNKNLLVSKIKLFTIFKQKKKSVSKEEKAELNQIESLQFKQRKTYILNRHKRRSTDFQFNETEKNLHEIDHPVTNNTYSNKINCYCDIKNKVSISNIIKVLSNHFKINALSLFRNIKSHSRQKHNKQNLDKNESITLNNIYNDYFSKKKSNYLSIISKESSVFKRIIILMKIIHMNKYYKIANNRKIRLLIILRWVSFIRKKRKELFLLSLFKKQNTMDYFSYMNEMLGNENNKNFITYIYDQTRTLNTKYLEKSSSTKILDDEYINNKIIDNCEISKLNLSQINFNDCNSTNAFTNPNTITNRSSNQDKQLHSNRFLKHNNMFNNISDRVSNISPRRDDNNKD